jgi:hypothetical protein
VTQTACGGTLATCGAGEGSATSKTIWEDSYSGLTGTSADPGFAPILASTLSGNDSIVFVRVSYVSGAVATCQPYTLTFSN